MAMAMAMIGHGHGNGEAKPRLLKPWPEEQRVLDDLVQQPGIIRVKVFALTAARRLLPTAHSETHSVHGH